MTRYMFMVFAGACSYGMLSTFVKLAYRQGFGPVHIAFLQALTGMCVLWVISLLKEKSRFRINAPLLATGAAIGLTSFVYYVSVQFIPASLAIVLLMQFVWMGILFDWLLFGQRPGSRHWLCVGLILAGTFLSSGISAGGQFPAGYWKGVGLALLSAFFYAVFIVANSKAGQDVPPVRKSAVMMTGASLTIFLVNCRTLVLTPLPGAGILPWTAFLAFFGTILPPLLFAKGIPKIGASMSALVMSAELPVAVLCSSLLLREAVNPLQWCGVGLMLAAMALLPKSAGKAVIKQTGQTV
ncbi:EamA family transporter [Chitinophaga caseinilytica]|uniref:EamA family transporter n=1 Tax=Chitinophaga caseinilytica TaxID=2267521 RepID=UPI003C2F6227